MPHHLPNQKMRNLIDMKSTMLREVAISIGMVMFILSGLWAYTGSWPPLVVVESNSMIHSEQGRYTIDAGDLVLVNSPEGPIKLSHMWNQCKKAISSLATRVMALPGDVIIYQRTAVLIPP